jgi:cytochrome c-type biogenesis protein CcmH
MQPAALCAAADPLVLVRSALLVVSVGVAALLFAPFSAEAEDEAVWGYALADELMSPWCPGFSLPDCSSGYAQDLRLWILEQEKLGRSREDVKSEILAKYGEQMLQAPPAEGRGMLAYAIPAAMIVAGLGVLLVFLRRQAASAAAAPAEAMPQAVDARLLSRVDAELARSQPTE